ncbi:MAG: rhomboid family intramembrane serine protease [Pseudomonadota bacterium]
MELAHAPATYAFIAVNVIISVYAFVADPRFFDEFCFHIGAVTRGKQYHRLITSAFLHADAMHLAFNMITLFSFGPVVERLLGTDGLIVIYVGSILASKLVAIYRNRRDFDYTAVGASGAVSGVILSFCLFYPFRDLYFFGLPFGIPAVIFGVGYMLLSARLMNNANRVIGHEAHLGGALGGIVLTVLMRPEAVTRWFA